VTVYLHIFARGLVMVTLVACNTRQIAAGHITGATMIGFLISWLWWSNSSKERPDVRGAAAVYGLGAAAGTVLGFAIASALSF
jgi:hypothetical protein